MWAGLQLFGGDDAEQVSVPRVTNMTQSNAASRLRQEGLELGEVERVNDEEVPQGRVISQDPDEGEVVDAGTAVDLVVSAGKEDVVVKYVVGMPKQEAAQVIRGLGLEVDFETRESTEDKNIVIETDPNAGETVPAGSTVTLVLSEGQMTVPSVVGRTEGEARQILREAGFEVSVTYDDDTPSQKGIVLRQDPSGSSSAPEGSTVSITVSSYEEPDADRQLRAHDPHRQHPGEHPHQRVDRGQRTLSP